MYEAMNMPISDIPSYLSRIGLSTPVKTDLDGLNALIYHHHTHVPFEDLDCCRLRRPISLEIPALFQKIVHDRRGGYCYELNALFTQLLRDLGFDARSVFCRVVRGRDFIPPCTHRGIVVSLEGDLWYCDVGYGGPMPAGALRVADFNRQTVCGETFLVERFDPNWWTISRENAQGQREQLLQFNTFPQVPQEFIAANQKAASDPESVFVQRLMVNLRTEHGALSINGNSFTVHRDGQSTTTQIRNDAQLHDILKTHFDILLPT